MDKTYDPNAIEQRCYQSWEKNNTFAPSGSGNPYCILLPPPNVTGSLHMGHGFGFTLVDILIRYHRMLGDNTLWQGGTDHAGIATQMVVERQLAAENISRHDLGREKFIEKIWAWKNTSGNRITQQLRRLGASIDWTREKFTLDESLSQAVREVFIRLYEEGLIYRGTRLVNWDPHFLTAISDLEVVNNEEDTHLWHIRYPIIGTKDHLVVATTRPETMLGDVAVAVNPDDERYTHLIGKQLQLPLTDRTIPIIADEYVEKDFGSGCVKITPAHDFNDYAVGQRHQLAPINIFTPNAHLNENAPEVYRGLERFKARKKIIQDLEALGLLEKTEKYRTKIPRGDRSGVIVEPYLTQQWFMKMESLAKPAVEAVKNGTLRFVPENWDKTWFQWLNNIEDWCISRQLWWGHRIPVWYDDAENIYVGHDEKHIREKYQLSDDHVLTQDNDVLDTWFSSALWPFSSLGWPENTSELKTFYPTSVLVTGFDIIFFWVARMVMLGLKFMKQIPFKEVYITGLIRDSEGHKMSKSKGNVLDPLDLIDGITLDALIKKRTEGLMQPEMQQKIEKNTRKEFSEGIQSYGTDALRFTFCALASHNREIRFDTGRLGGYRNFCNKLWNAARYVLMNTENHDTQPGETSSADRWILSQLQKTIQTAQAHLDNYRFDLLAHTLYEFTWNDFCDWYLELSKPVLTSSESTPAQLRGTRHTLLKVLADILHLLHPITPFITEEIWQRVAPLAGEKAGTLMLNAWPKVNTTLIDQSAEDSFTWLKNIIVAIRTLRSEMNISPAKKITLLLRNGNEKDRNYIEIHHDSITTLAKVEKIDWLKKSETPEESATVLVGTLDIFIPMADLIDRAQETERLKREIQKLTQDIDRTQTKLNNPNFVERAPKEVVEKDQTRLQEMRATVERLKNQLNALAKIPL
ncbi:MAG: valine--tRNA ligase [Gammaproteobacteria bacterium]|nr:valine--tRNA ligase [Gammaproteobacteria bacterium]